VHTRLDMRTSSDPSRAEISGIFEQRMSKQRRISDRLISRYSDSGSSARAKLVGCDNDSEKLGGKLYVFSAARTGGE